MNLLWLKKGFKLIQGQRPILSIRSVSSCVFSSNTLHQCKWIIENEHSIATLPLYSDSYVGINRLLKPKVYNVVIGFPVQQRYWYSTTPRQWSWKKGSSQDNTNTNLVLYILSVLVFMLGLSYAAVPLYRMFCQATGLGGDPKLGHKTDLVETMQPIRERRITVTFNADHHATMKWNFKPSQKRITVVPGETALAFYTAKNPTDEPIVGIATYNVVPFQAGLYFNKIQCFCFEKQWLNPHEEVDMPVFFYIDPDFDNDPQLANVDDIILSYTFFKAEEGQTLPMPGFMSLQSVQSAPA